MPLRYEYKYLVACEKMETLRKLVLPFVRYDHHCENLPDHQYTVRSIYFDTPFYTSYFEKIEGIKHRKKFRLRGYNLPDVNSRVFFEIKRKYEDPIKKNRASVTFEEAIGFFSHSPGQHPSGGVSLPEGFEDENLQRFFYHYYAERLRPVILVIYEREAFVGRYDETIRVTFDKNLRSVAYPALDELYCEKNCRSALQGKFILEVKFNDHFPSWMKSVVALMNLKRQSASKYVICMQSHNLVRSGKFSFTFPRSDLLNRKNID